jgi:hypothetical protein
VNDLHCKTQAPFLYIFSLSLCRKTLKKISSFSSPSLYLEKEHPFLESIQEQNSKNYLFTHGFYCFLQKNIYTSLKPTIPIRPVRGGCGPDWAEFACFPQPAPQWTGLKIEICNLHSEWSTRWASGNADRDGFMRVRVFFLAQNQKNNSQSC